MAGYRSAGGTRKGLEWGKFYSFLWKTRQLLENVDAVICVGLEEYELARKALPQQRVYFLPGGVDVQSFAQGNRERGRQLLGIPSNEPLILCPARIDRQKDQLTLVQAWAAAEIPNSHLALVGDETSPGYLDECKQAAAPLISEGISPGRAEGISDKQQNRQLITPGNQAPENMPDILAAADLVVLPSRHEPFGLACLEAWAASRPVAVSQVGGLAWMLQQCPEAGYGFPSGDVSALQKILKSTLTSSGEQKAGQIGRTWVEANCTWQHRADKLKIIYEDVGVQFAK